MNREWEDYRERISNMTGDDVKKWLADKSFKAPETTEYEPPFPKEVMNSSTAGKNLNKVYQDLMKGQLLKGELEIERKELEVPEEKLNAL